MDMIGKVRRMKLRDQLSLSEISKRTGLARNTVKKWLKAPGDEPPKYERRAVERKLAAFEGTLHQALAADVCWRRWNIDQLCRLNFDQGLRLPPQEVSCG